MDWMNLVSFEDTQHFTRYDVEEIFDAKHSWFSRFPEDAIENLGYELSHWVDKAKAQKTQIGIKDEIITKYEQMEKNHELIQSNQQKIIEEKDKQLQALRKLLAERQMKLDASEVAHKQEKAHLESQLDRTTAFLSEWKNQYRQLSKAIANLAALPTTKIRVVDKDGFLEGHDKLV
jgi:chromosome segregation ATPase